MRVLIVSPHFPPTNAADMQRVRLILPYLKNCGIDAEILAVDHRDVASPTDHWLAEHTPSEIPIHITRALGLKWSKLPGLGTLSQRSLISLLFRGDRLLRDGGFELVYFSTTLFQLHQLGPRWKKLFNVPFVIDYQDPWVSDYYRNHPNITPPGGSIKYSIIDRINRWLEPLVLKDCSGITSVSSDYPSQLIDRYACSDLPFLVIPFPADSRDMNCVRNSASIVQTAFDPKDGNTHWVYVGRGGLDMHTAIKGFFGAISCAGKRFPEQLKKLRLHFIGTSYAAEGAGEKTIEPIAEEYGLGDIVNESPNRIPYSESLRCLLDADALFVPGSDDSGYTASKIFPYLLAEKPLLTVFHEKSSVNEVILATAGATSICFTSEISSGELSGTIVKNIFSESLSIPSKKLDHDGFLLYSAENQARQLERFFSSLS